MRDGPARPEGSAVPHCSVEALALALRGTRTPGVWLIVLLPILWHNGIQAQYVTAVHWVGYAAVSFAVGVVYAVTAMWGRARAARRGRRWVLHGLWMKLLAIRRCGADGFGVASQPFEPGDHGVGLAGPAPAHAADHVGALVNSAGQSTSSAAPPISRGTAARSFLPRAGYGVVHAGHVGQRCCCTEQRQRRAG